MRISDILKSNENTLSFEVFPPKTTKNYETVKNSVMEVARLKPDFISVTYGAGGGTSMYTAKLAKEVQENYDVVSMAHLSCVTSTRDMVREQVRSIKSLGIENILALRGDLVDGMDISHLDYHYAKDLVKEIMSIADFCIGGACYPEGHPECGSLSEDIEHIKEKVEAGCEFLTTQMFFKNDLYYSYVEKLNKVGVNVPILAGIMPMTNYKQVERSKELSNAYFPDEFLEWVEKYKTDNESFYKAGVDYAITQIRDLREHGVKNLHIYTMNKANVAKEIMEALG